MKTKLLLPGLAAITVGAVLLLPPISQDPRYHEFVDQRTIWGVPNFWNVVSNLAFLPVVVFGLRALRRSSSFTQAWERGAYRTLLLGVALVAFGSGYYHLHPDTASLFWDRLPMTIVFTSLLATTIGERISMSIGHLLLWPLLAVGAASVLCWRFSGDLRLYVIVQFFPMIALPLMLMLFPPRYSGSRGILAMIGFYCLAKLLELSDHQLGGLLATGGHPWKHVAAALGMLCYVITVSRRESIFLARFDGSDSRRRRKATRPQDHAPLSPARAEILLESQRRFTLSERVIVYWPQVREATGA